MKTYFFSLLLILSVVSCDNSRKKDSGESKSEEQVPEAIALSGKKLYQIPADSATLAKYTLQIEEYQKKETFAEDDFIGLGNAYASIYRFRDAIKVYTDGLSKYPDSYKLLQFRAHRQLSIREADGTLADVEKALTYMNDTTAKELELQADGTVKGSYEYWIYYHMGLASLLKDNYDDAISAFKNCVRSSVTQSNKAGATYWLYNSYLKAGQNQKAEELINEFVLDKPIDATPSYTARLLMLNGKIAPEELLDIEAENNSSDWGKKEVSMAYDVANWYIMQGEVEKGMAIHRKTLESPHWNAWAYLMTEKELLVE